jgi:hypothetical protein
VSQTTLSICVFCGSRPGADPAYVRTARELGAAIGGLGWRLVFGAGDIGIMGEVARAAQTAGAEALGVIPQHLEKAEVAKRDISSLIVTETMHERKKVMYMNSDAIAVLPGGAGTLDEFFEVLTWAQLGLHAKPILVLNVNGYWDPLTALVDHVVTQGFADDSLRRNFTVVSSVEELVDRARRAGGTR